MEMFENMSQDEIKKMISGSDKDQVMGMLSGTEGFAKFLLLSNVLNEGNHKIAGLLEESDLSDETTFAVFQKVVLDIYGQAPEIILSLVDNPHVQKAISEETNWSVGFMEKAEKLYNESSDELLTNKEYEEFLEKRLLTDILYQKFKHRFVKLLIQEEKENKATFQKLRNSVEKAIQEKLFIGLNQYIFLSFLMQISLADEKKRARLLSEMISLYKLNKSFFTKEQCTIFKGLNAEIKEG